MVLVVEFSFVYLLFLSCYCNGISLGMIITAIEFYPWVPVWVTFDLKVTRSAFFLKYELFQHLPLLLLFSGDNCHVVNFWGGGSGGESKFTLSQGKIHISISISLE